MDQYRNAIAALLQNTLPQRDQGAQAPIQQLLWPDAASLLSEMQAEHAKRIDPRLYMREINPGTTWGGRDRNAIRPDDVMQSYFSTNYSDL
jgi:hypothetical protein